MSQTAFSRSTNCRVTDALTYCGMQALVMENELLQVLILPQKGAGIYALRYKPLNIDPLLHYRPLQTPAPFPATISVADGAFADVYDGGWQVMFPSGGGPNAALNTAFGRHGEAALLPWAWKIIEDTPQKVSVCFWLQMTRTPFYYERLLSLESGKAELLFDESITNRGGESLPFMWGHHPAFGAPFLDGSCVLDAPQALLESVEEDSEIARVPAGVRVPWPLASDKAGQALDLRFIPPEGGHTADMLYLSGFSQGWYALSNRSLGLGFALFWDVNVFPCLWIWQEFGGTKGFPWYYNTYALGLEPCTHYSTRGGGGLGEVISRQQARYLAAGDNLRTSLRAVLYTCEGAAGVEEIQADGRIKLRY